MTSPQASVVSVDRKRYAVKYRTIHGYRRAFVHCGRGPGLLLLHGIGDSSDTWRDIIPQLAKHYTVIAPDLLGYGRSDRPRADYSVAAYACGMRDLLSVLDIEKVTVVGHSLGGGVAMQFAYQFPERCERLVLVSTAGVGREVHPALRLVALPGMEAVLPLLGTAPIRRVGSAVLSLLEQFDTNVGHDAEDLAMIFDALPDRQARSAFVRTVRAGVDSRGQVITMLDRCYLAAGIPIMLVWGQRDAIIPVKHAHLALESMPGSRLEIFPDAGHFPHHHDPDRFVSMLRDFIDRTEPASYSVGQWRSLLRLGRQRTRTRTEQAVAASGSSGA